MAQEKPRALVFAIMRNGHEVLRSSMADMAAALQVSNAKEALKQFNAEYEGFKKWQGIHASMEEGKPGVCKVRILPKTFKNTQ